MEDRTTERLKAEIEAIVAIVEEWTGCPSRWSGEVVIVDSVSALLLARQPFLAKKEWNCRIAVMDRIVDAELRWRTLIHEVLHSVSTGSREADYRLLPGWEEGVVEALQRLYRPGILERLGIVYSEAVFAVVEQHWGFAHYLTALYRLRTQLPEVSEREFFEALIQTELANRPATVLSWGKRDALDPSAFVRLFAEVSGRLRR